VAECGGDGGDREALKDGRGRWNVVVLFFAAEEGLVGA
jgi:hypothetical protein